MSLLYETESFAINGAAMEVHTTLGSGFLEAVYQQALEVELTDRGIPFVAQPQLSVRYKDRQLSAVYIPDFVCYDKIIVEIKAVKELTQVETAQILNYLKATGFRLGFLYNFGSSGKLERKRFAK